jgi:predicted esterase
MIPTGMEPILELPTERAGGELSPRSGIPLAFLVPAAWMRDADGNSVGPNGVCDALKELAAAIRKEGYATLRFSLPHGQPFHEEQVHAIFEYYEKAQTTPGIDASRTLLLGVCEGADLIARTYYDFLLPEPPAAAILLSPTVRPIHLNNLTCPYLVIHGADDPQFRFMSYQKVKDAVRHHQMRYGDSTTSYLLPSLGSELGSPKMDERVLKQVTYWVRSLRKANRTEAAA